MELKYKRVLVKLSGEALKASADGILDFDMVDTVAAAVKKCVDAGVEVAVLVGAGNIWRGAGGVGMNRARADHMGMLATVINSIALEDSFRRAGLDAVALSAVEMNEFAELYTRDKADKYLKQGKVVILGAGSGNPFFTTDTAAIIRAAELEVDVAILAKNIDAIYDKDPRKFADAVRFDTVDYDYIIDHKLKVIDLAATTLSSENNVPLLLCALEDPENIYRAVSGEKIGTVVTR